jgi:hypothetical protein
VSIDEIAYQGELQYLRHMGRLDLVAGLGIAYVPSDNQLKLDLTFHDPPPSTSFPILDTAFENSQRYRNFYGYGSWRLGSGITLVTGLRPVEPQARIVVERLESHHGARGRFPLSETALRR